MGSALCFTACDDYDDTALWEQVNSNTSRIEALEQWQTETNNNIAALQTLLTTNDMITSVTPVKVGDEVTGYTLSFLYSDPITIYNGTQGEAGDTPQIGLTQDKAGDWYWTLNGELMTDADGNPIRANGEDGKDGQDGADGEDGQDGADGSDGRPGSTGRPGTPAPTPQIKLGSALTSGTYYGINGTQQTAPDTGAWYLSVDNGASWYRISGENGSSGSSGSTGAQGPAGPAGPQGPQGDSFFAKAPELSEDGSHYIFTLADADNTTIKVPAYQPLTIGEGTGTLTVSANGTSNITLTLDEDYTAIVAQITPEDDNTAIATRADNSWSVEATLNDDGTATITITAPASGKALLDVSLIRADGSKVTASRVLQVDVLDDGQEITEAGNYTMSGSYSQGITISAEGVNLNLANATLTTSDIGINVQHDATINVIGADNTITSSGSAGIYVAQGSTVTITGESRDDQLDVVGGYGSCGIGGYEAYDGSHYNNIGCGSITIQQVTVSASSSDNDGSLAGSAAAPGIGGPGDVPCGSITIDNATVYAHGGTSPHQYAPGIGSGYPRVGAPSGIPTVIIKNNSIVHAHRGGSAEHETDYIGYPEARNPSTDGQSTCNFGTGGSAKNSTVYCYTGETSDKTMVYDESGNPKEQANTL